MGAGEGVELVVAAGQPAQPGVGHGGVVVGDPGEAVDRAGGVAGFVAGHGRVKGAALFGRRGHRSRSWWLLLGDGVDGSRSRRCGPILFWRRGRLVIGRRRFWQGGRAGVAGIGDKGDRRHRRGRQRPARRLGRSRCGADASSRPAAPPLGYFARGPIRAGCFARPPMNWSRIGATPVGAADAASCPLASPLGTAVAPAVPPPPPPPDGPSPAAPAGPAESGPSPGSGTGSNPGCGAPCTRRASLACGVELLPRGRTRRRTAAADPAPARPAQPRAAGPARRAACMPIPSATSPARRNSPGPRRAPGQVGADVAQQHQRGHRDRAHHQHVRERVGAAQLGGQRARHDAIRPPARSR